ncbi:hypothetical protein ACS0TY_024376 [Phlomoides rotata]
MLTRYSNLGMVKVVNRLFDKMPQRDFMSWNTMVMAYVQSGWFDDALRFYMELRRSDIGFNEYSFAGVLIMCVKLRDLWLAKQLHCQVFVLGYMSNVVLSNSILDAYAKCGEMGDAKWLFDEMKERDILAWTTLLSGYAKCGDMKSAHEVFDEMPEKNSVSWTSLIVGYAHKGMGHHALELFTKTIKLNVKPDQFTYSSLFFACASIISPNHVVDQQHYACLIDLLGRSGCFDEMMNQLKKIPCEHDDHVWKALVGVCRIHGNVELGEMRSYYKAKEKRKRKNKPKDHRSIQRPRPHKTLREGAK